MKRILPVILLSLVLLACGTLSALPTPVVPTDSPATVVLPTPTTLPIPSPTLEPIPACGDGTCTAPEDHTSCPTDCGNLSDSQLVPFPADSPAARHAFYPLVGQHAQVACEGCHNSGQYQGIPNTCGGCHILTVPSNHFAGDCVACHVPEGWQLVSFDHQQAGATDCLACHFTDAPLNHFVGQCSTCHSTVAWQPATFDHTLAGTDCLSCHTNDAPANHFAGQCSTCHLTTTTWTGASYPHVFPTWHGGANNNCTSCHPVNTASWTCSVCHNDAAMLSKHNEEGISNIANCLRCHPTGQEGEND
ncbi:MAG: hypothetical protein H6636_14105 [Anaerolineales bacterium]|nr:hypothetical protein [Anaerolineales bacterium]